MRNTLLLLAILSPIMASAQTPADSIPPQRKIIDFTIDEKVIYVNELGLPPNTPLLNVLQIIPEFLGRDIQSILGNYDLQIDDISMASANKYNILLHTMISEVDHLEITTDPSYAESSSAIGGVIDVMMKKAVEGVDGQASLDLTSDLGFIPTASVSYQKDKLTIYGSAFLKYYDYNTRTTERNEDNNQYTYDYRENYNQGFNEGVKFGLIYNFTDRDKLTFWALQDYESSRDSISDVTAILNTIGSQTYKAGFKSTYDPIKSSQVDAILKYERFYDRPTQKLYISLSYNNTYGNNDNTTAYLGDQYTSLIYDKFNDQYISRPNIIGLSAYYRFHLLPRDSEHELRLKAGLSSNLNMKDGTQNTTVYYPDSTLAYTFNDYTRNLTATPYAIFYYKWSKLNMELGMRYRFKAMFGRGEDAEWQEDYFHNFLGNFNITYKPAERHQLRASTARTLSSPNNVQLYSNQFYNTAAGYYQKGNRNLQDAVLQNVDLQYLYHFQNLQHDLQLSFAVEYINAQNLIEATVVTDPSGDSYHTWENSDITKHIVDGRLSLFWQTNVFSMSFCANVFDKITPAHENVAQQDEYYYNLCLQPILHFEKGWTLSGTFIYNSKFYQGSYVKGDALNFSMNINKAWGPWAIRLNFYNIFDYLSNDVKTTATGVENTYYHQYHCQILAGFTYCFGNKWKKPKNV